MKKNALLISLLLCTTAAVSANEVQTAFNTIDRNNDGNISYHEFKRVMLSSEEDIQELHKEFVNADKNRNGQLSFEEAKAFEASPKQFRDADKNNNQQVSLEEFNNAMMQKMFKEADSNRNKQVSLAEFTQAMDD